ncbi:MAG: META domain-containing protein [Synergistaceae bacterium]|nr:META domain-containing protein [Synergistaceae bacterium]
MSKKNLTAIFLSACLAFAFHAFGPVWAAEPTDDGLFVREGGKTYILHRVYEGETIEGEGQFYEAPDDPSTYFKSWGGYAELSIDGRLHSRYTLIRDTSDPEEIIFTADGVNFVMKRVMSASGAKYEVPGDPQTYFWSKGESATLFIEGEKYAGYDSWLPPGGISLTEEGIPTGVEWRVKSISGVGVIDGSTVTVTFHPDGTSGGIASVNNYRSTWMSLGDRIIIGDGITTKKMGPPDLMEQEIAYLGALSEVTRFEFRGNDLALVTKQGSEIILTRDR